MPDKDPSENESDWINYMRLLKRKYPSLEKVSRKVGYPLMSPFYQQWKEKYYKKELTKSQIIDTMIHSIKKLPKSLKHP